MGYAPADDPQIAIYVVVDRPNVFAQADAKYATRIVRKVLTEVLPYMGIFRTEELSDKEREELEALHIQLTTPQEDPEEQLLDEDGNPIETEDEEGQEEGDGEEGEDSEAQARRNVWKNFPVDPETGYLKDPDTGYLYDPELGTQVYGDSMLGEEQGTEGDNTIEDNNPDTTE